MRARPYRLSLTALLGTGALCCALSLELSRHGFSGYDVSPMIDAGWRVLLGQVPGRDFVVTFPASLYLLTALSFRLFGVTWHALAVGACLVYGILLLLGLRVASLISRQADRSVALRTFFFYFTAQTIPLVSINYLWHASLAQSFGCYAVYACFAALADPPTTSASVRWEPLAHLSLAGACLLLSKPNTAFPVILLCAAVLLQGGVRRLHVAFTLLAAMLLGTLALARVHVTPWGMLAAYVGLTGRLVPKAFAHAVLYRLYARDGLATLLVYAILAPALFAALAPAWRNRRQTLHDPLPLLGVGAILVSLLGMGTNYDFKLTDAPLALLGLAILSAPSVPELHVLRFRAATAAVCLLFVALYFGRTRFRMQNVGTWADDKCPGQVTFDDPFLGHFRACPEVPATLAEVDRALSIYPGQHVFFGPALEFLYAARGISPPLHLPDWWDPGSSYPLRQSEGIAKAWETQHLDLLIFEHGEDREQLPPRVQDDLRTRYRLVPGNTLIHVYRPLATDPATASGAPGSPPAAIQAP